VDVAGYLRRLGLTRAAPSAEALRALHEAHARRVPYECLEIWLGRATTVDPAESARRIVGGRGGYCFHLNGAFSLLLRSLGYQVTRHVGGVQGTGGQPGIHANHLVLTVRDLPSPEAPDGSWLVDLGMGDGLFGPLPLAAGDYQQGPFRYRLRPSEVAPGGWRFEHDPRGSFPGMDFRAEPTAMSAFDDQHRRLTTDPSSGFVRVATVARRDETGVDLLRGLILTRIGEAGSRTVLTDRGDYFTALADVFGLTLDDVTPPERDAFWQRLTTAHEAHEA